jgi:hypothetical protein
MQRIKELKIGQRFHSLTIVGLGLIIRKSNGCSYTAYPCDCDCGARKDIALGRLTSGRARSCGCRYQAPRHGENRSRIHRCWTKFRQRCSNPRDPDYKNYGGRGITYATCWTQYEAFRDWALANGYQNNLTLERKDVNGNYEPNNCTWATQKEQARNQRRSRIITAFGETKQFVDWVQDPRCAVSMNTLSRRLYKYNWDPERAITEPPDPSKVRR